MSVHSAGFGGWCNQYGDMHACVSLALSLIVATMGVNSPQAKLDALSQTQAQAQAQGQAHAPPHVQAETSSRGAETWISPVTGRIRVDRPFDLPNGPFRAGHRGIDLPTTPGEAVRAPTSGTVTFVGTVVDRAVMSLRTDEQTVLSLEPVSSDLTIGAVVAKGQLIGEVSEGGHCSGECLHVGVRINNEYVNPLRFFLRKPTLLPTER